MATTMQVQQPPAIVTTQVPLLIPQPQQPSRNSISVIKGLAVTQLVIGILSLILGIASVVVFSGSGPGPGIWAGVFIIVAGVLGVCSSQDYYNTCLNGVYMAFSIISTCASFVAGLLCLLALTRAYYYIPILGIYVPLFLLLLVEFFISITAAVFCCQKCCRGNMQKGGNVQQPQQVMMVPAPGNTAGAYPANVVQYQQYGGQVVPQHGGQAVPQHGGQVVPQHGGQAAPQYNAQVPVQYVSQVPPGQPPVNAQPQPPVGTQPHHFPQATAALAEMPPVYSIN